MKVPVYTCDRHGSNYDEEDEKLVCPLCKAEQDERGKKLWQKRRKELDAFYTGRNPVFCPAPTCKARCAPTAERCPNCHGALPKK